jgi:DMSO/TMAO reductase YedYZ molybdopterin-dependent catalytic subunit
MKQERVLEGYQPLLVGAALGGLTSLPVIALSYLGAKLVDLPFVPFDVFDWLARVLPGNVITLGIDSIVRIIQLLGLGRISGTAKTIEQGMGVLLVIAGGAALGLAIAWLNSRTGPRDGGRTGRPAGSIGWLLGTLAFLIVAAIELMLGSSISGNAIGSLLWLAILFVGWGAFLGSRLAAPELAPAPANKTEELQASRRVFLVKLVGGSLGVAVVASGVGRLLQVQNEASGAGQALSTLATSTPQASGSGGAASPTVSARIPPAITPGSEAPTVTAPTPLPKETAAATIRDRVQPAPGTRPEVTANKDFYRTDIDTLPLVIDKATWKLQVTGLFDRPRSLTMTDLLAYPAITQPITQSCISNPIAGDLISTSNWVGVRLRDVLKDLGLRPEAKALAIRAADGFYESVVMEDLQDPRTLLVYGMNGDTLPSVHGFPLRIYIPNHYGMKQPKWITSIEAIDHDGPGYWVDRGWSATAYPQIVSVIDTVAGGQAENGKVPIGGIAWAGDRGIRKVEVQVDGGDWVEATLRTPPLSPLTWVQWRYDWPLARGSHTFRVRATDGSGTLQIEQPADTYPDGATGYHSVTAGI